MMVNTGRIIKGIGGFYYVSTTDTLYECKAKGSIKLKNKLLVGDIVDFDDVTKNILKIHKRKNYTIRPEIANIDQIIIFMSITFPKPDFLVLDKILINNQTNNIESIIVFNKVDEADEDTIKKIKKIYANSGHKLYFISAKFNTNSNEYEKLIDELNGKFSVLSGNSGVGKSTFINKVLNSDAIKTGDISLKIKRGKHTTRHSEIFRIDNNTFIADTPGYGRFDILKIDADTLKDYYKEFNEYNNCHFSCCTHSHEPKCGVTEAVNKRLVSNDRYCNYLTIYKELKKHEKY